jgi:hypothetical protein
MSQDISDSRTSNWGWLFVNLWSVHWACAGGLVVAVGVQDQFSQEFAGEGVDDPAAYVLPPPGRNNGARNAQV